MSLNPSNMIAANDNKGKTMLPNLARRGNDSSVWLEVDSAVNNELRNAGIPSVGPHDWLRHNREVPAGYMGELCMWGFRRAWYYWIASGPGIPADKAEEFHKTWGTHCGCPSPIEYCHGFSIGQYHIDTQEGLKAFAELLRSIYVE